MPKKFIPKLLLSLLLFNIVVTLLNILVFKQSLSEMVKSSPFIMGNVLVILSTMTSHFYGKDKSD